MAESLCYICKKNVATVKIYQGTSKLFLCEECRIKQMVESISGALFTSTLGENAMQRRVCPDCQTEIDFVKKSGFVGCPSCYRTFSDILVPYIKQTQYALEHKGKHPLGEVDNTRAQIDALKAQMKRCADQEDYNEAARLKALIQKLEGQA